MMTTTPQNPNYRRGDIVLVLFPNSNLRTAKTRPALVVQRGDLNSGLAQVVVCMKGIPLESFQPRNGRVEQSGRSRDRVTP